MTFLKRELNILCKLVKIWYLVNVANCVHTADATKQFRRVGVGGVYWALETMLLFKHCHFKLFSVHCVSKKTDPYDIFK